MVTREENSWQEKKKRRKKEKAALIEIVQNTISVLTPEFSNCNQGTETLNHNGRYILNSGDGERNPDILASVFPCMYSSHKRKCNYKLIADNSKIL